MNSINSVLILANTGSGAKLIASISWSISVCGPVGSPGSSGGNPPLRMKDGTQRTHMYWAAGGPGILCPCALQTMMLHKWQIPWPNLSASTSASNRFIVAAHGDEQM